MLLLLQAQPLVKVVTFPTSIIDDAADMTINLGGKPTDIPEPFASVIRSHLAARPKLRTCTERASPWLFPGYVAGRHLHPNTVTMGPLRRTTDCVSVTPHR